MYKWHFLGGIAGINRRGLLNCGVEGVGGSIETATGGFVNFIWKYRVSPIISAKFLVKLFHNYFTSRTIDEII